MSSRVGWPSRRFHWPGRVRRRRPAPKRTAPDRGFLAGQAPPDEDDQDTQRDGETEVQQRRRPDRQEAKGRVEQQGGREIEGEDVVDRTELQELLPVVRVAAVQEDRGGTVDGCLEVVHRPGHPETHPEQIGQRGHPEGSRRPAMPRGRSRQSGASTVASDASAITRSLRSDTTCCEAQPVPSVLIRI